MNKWIDNLRFIREKGEDAVLVTVVDVRGSAPRECGAKMLVTATDLIGTIGGGQLEYQCTKLACERLRQPDVEGPQAFVQRFPLGSNCGQCCGGVVEVLFETLAAGDAPWVPDLLGFYDQRIPVVIVTALAAGPPQKFLVTVEECRAYGAASRELQAVIGMSARDMFAGPAFARRLRVREPGDVSLLLEPLMSSQFNIALFGAGHVGSAVVAAMAALDCSIRWIDSRRGIFPGAVPDGVTCLETASPAREVAAMPANSFYLVMTHSHPLDFDICSAILKRADFAYCGLIGSLSKRRRFERLMRKQGMQDVLLGRLTCPIGIAGIDSKQPEAIAIAVAAELLQRNAASAATEVDPSTNVHVLNR